MPIHPTFNYIPCSMPRNHHASPNHQWPITMLHDMMDMLRSNVFSMISNPTLWPTIGVKPIYICCVTENHAFPIIDGPILIPWANRKRARTYLRLIIGFHCYICAPNPTSLKARLTLMLDNNLHVSYHICFCYWRCSSKLTFSNESDTTPLLLVCKKLWTPSSLSFNPCPLHHSLDMLQDIGLCPLKRQLCG